MNETGRTEPFLYPQKINQLDPVFYRITVEDVEGSFEGVESEFMLERNGVKIPLKEVLNKLLAKSTLANQFTELFERVEIMMNTQAAFFKSKRKTDLDNAKMLEGKTRNFIEVCRATYKTLKKFNQE
jgi:hypothetical protein